MSGTKGKERAGSHHRRSNSAASKDGNGSLARTAEKVALWMRARCDPGLSSIDMLLTRPVDAMRMAIDVAAQLDRISTAKMAELTNLLDHLESTAAVKEIEVICRAAMNARKRGLLGSSRLIRKERGHAAKNR